MASGLTVIQLASHEVDEDGVDLGLTPLLKEFESADLRPERGIGVPALKFPVEQQLVILSQPAIEAAGVIPCRIADEIDRALFVDVLDGM